MIKVCLSACPLVRRLDSHKHLLTSLAHDGSRLDDGAAGYVVALKNGQTWKGIKTHMGYNQEAFDAECAALARALESASRRNTIPERVTIFTDAQAAIKRMASAEED